ncbi:hypothetical protein B0H13DRAFT_2664550 [Mycena leptocephala]|nr:hypothetical protein B0H13DRAFT_2664550 [Mycena leptocephala]
MSTRTRTRTASTAKSSTVKPAPKSKAPPKSKRSDDIENDRPKATPRTTKSKTPTSAVYCLCRKGDDGSPMVNCGECEEWYHFGCVSLNEQTAEDINVYVCPSCTEKTGHRTVMLWEGPDAVEDVSKTSLKGAPTAAAKKVVVAQAPGPEPELEPPADADSAEDPSSEDEYVADSLKAKGSTGVAPKRRRARRLSFSSEESGSDESEAGNSGRSRKPASPGASGKGQLKRKAQTQKARAPPPKRKREASSDASDDPARAFCLGKLEGVFHDIFLRYPHEEKAKVEEEAKQFATDLEQCVYDIYSEPDKQGKSSAGGKYKDRFRMLQFNLSKIDRTVLHKRIASADITPKEISLMSSTDLANEQTKQSIKIAEKEALEHSILEKTVIPRAKLTHKGLEDIEGADNEIANLREREIQRQREEEEKRERERAARLRSQRQRTTSVSVPPESPTTPGGASWGGPPRVPVHAMTPTEEMPMGGSFGGLAGTAEMSLEPEMNLADLINIDDESPVAQDAPPLTLAPSSPIPGFGRALSPPAPSPTLPTATIPVPIEEPQDKKDEMMDLDETDDKDFDMFLEEKEGDAVASSPEALQAAFNDLPQVWSGKINMPLDSTIPQETPVVARQIGGRTLEFGSLLWKTLFPSELLRIDGRVPVDNRHGLVFPWGSRPKDFHPGKELYIIPLLSSDSLPDYMELLDNLHLPKIRNTNYLIGIWVLNKGKLAPPPPPPAPVSAPAPAPAVAIPPFNMPPLPPTAPVAALTPEQVRMMLQSLTATTLNSIPVPAPMPPPQTAPPPPQAWGGHRAMPPGPPPMGYPPLILILWVTRNSTARVRAATAPRSAGL